jgi:flagellar export protein FliJ
MRKRNGLKSVQTLAKSAEAETSSQVSSHHDSRQSTGINNIRSRQGFMQKLSEAIAAQRQAVSQSLMQLEIQLGSWREARSRALSLQKFSERVTEETDKRQARKDQKELDNIARHQTGR